MNHATVFLHPAMTVGSVDPRIFGGFVEHLGRCVYEGLYDPSSAHADEFGYRRDVLDALRELKFTAMRYPGGNFVSGYEWQDGVGPQENRPKKRDLAWQTLEPNTFGTDEFMRLSKMMGWTPMFAANLGTGTPADARNWLEYCNGEPGTYWADMRVANGSIEPHDVKLWCLGNEMDGPWQIGHVPAEEYAVRAQQTARLMKMFDPEVELVLCGSCTIGLPTYMEWDRKVLEYTYNDVEYLSVHRYVGNDSNDTEDYMGIGTAIDKQIEEIDSTCKYVQAKLRSKKKVGLSFDEWNVWYRANSGADVDGKGKYAPHLLEEVYNLEDALVAAQFLNSFVRHADCVKIANLAQIVNVIAPLLTKGDEMIRQSIFYPIEMFATRREGTSLQTGYSGPTMTTKAHIGTPIIDSSAILNGSHLNVFLVNRSVDKEIEVKVDLATNRIIKLANGQLVTGSDPKAFNEFGREPKVTSVPFDQACLSDGAAFVTLPALSFAAMTFDIAG